MDVTVTWIILLMMSIHCILLFSVANGSTSRLHKRFSKADICHETKNTLEFVSMCPDTDPRKLKQSMKKQCDRFPACNGEPLVYHCARYKESLVEVCAPRHFITGKCCALYDDGLGRVVEDYSRPCLECSFRYQSDDPLNYGKCLKTSVNNTSNRDTNKNAGTKCDEKMGRHKRDTNCNEKKGSGKMEQNGLSLSTEALVVVPVFSLIAAIGIAFFIRRHLKTRQRQATTLNSKDELLDDTTTINGQDLILSIKQRENTFFQGLPERSEMKLHML